MAAEHRDLKRRRATVGVALVAGGLSLAALWAIFLRDPAAHCRDQQARFAGVWDAQLRAAIETNLERTGPPHAEPTWQAVERGLDEYATRWAGVRSDACQAAAVRGELSAIQLQQRNACLDRRLAAMRVLVGALADPNSDFGWHTVRAVYALPAPELCTARGSLTEPPPAGASVLEAQLTELELLIVTERVDDALQRAQQLGVTAAEQSDKGLRAKATFLLGEAQRLAGDAEQASLSLRRAAMTASAAADDELAARAWSRLVYVMGVERAEPEQADRIAEHAAAVIERLGSEQLQAQLETNQGWVLLAQGRAADAVQLFAKSLAWHEAQLGPDHFGLSPVLDGLAAAKRRAGDIDQATALWQRMLRIVRRATGPRHPDLAAIHGRLGQVLRDGQRLEEASSEHQAAVELFENTVGAEHPSVGQQRVSLGEVLSELGRHDEAIVQLERGLAIETVAYPAGHPSHEVTRLALSRAHERAERWPQALQQLEKVVQLREARLGPEHVEVGTALLALGRVQHRAGRDREALEHIARGLELLEAGHGSDSVQLIDGLELLADVRVAMKLPEAALGALEAAVAGWERGSVDATVVARAHFALARVMLAAGRSRDEALQLAQIARVVLADAGVVHTDRIREIDSWLAANGGGSDWSFR